MPFLKKFGLHEVNAVDAAGVHPLLLAVGSERYTPYTTLKQPQELLTIANHILGFGQLSLAKYLFITNKDDNPELSCNDIENYFTHFLERVDWKRDVHFQTNTTIDTLDYSGNAINSGSKVVMAAVGEAKRKLIDNCPIDNGKLVMSGVIAMNGDAFTTYENAQKELETLNLQLQTLNTEGIMLIVLVDDADFVATTLNNFLWVTFTRSNPQMIFTE